MPEPSLSQLIQNQLMTEAVSAGAQQREELQLAPTGVQTTNPGGKPLTPETRARYFKVATEYLRNGFNGTAAYMAVYPEAKRNSAGASVARVLKHTEVQSFLKSVWDRMTDEAELDTQFVMRELLNQALANPVDYLPDGDTTDLAQTLSHIKALPNHVQRRLRQVNMKHRTYTYEDGSTSDSTDISLKTVDQQAAIRDIAKIQGILRDGLDVSVQITTAEIVTRAVARAKAIKSLDSSRVFDEAGQLIEDGELVDGHAQALPDPE